MLNHAETTCRILGRGLAAALLAGTLALSCTPNWIKVRDQADLLYGRGDLEGAAEAYRQAYAENPRRGELTLQAGEAYARLRDYEAAAQAFAPIAEETDKYPTAGLEYGRNLKRSGDYNGAITALQRYRQAYDGSDKPAMEEAVYREIDGARLALRATLPADPNLQFGRLGATVNSDGNEYAPISFPNQVLYFTSTVGGKARLYRTQREGEGWIRPAVPETFPRIQGEAFGHGSLAPDGSRFYFTICGDSPVYDPATDPCAIFVLNRISGVWSQPERLSEVINPASGSSSQPFVVHRDGKEWLFFASTRPGGAGGMDLWYATRDRQNQGTFQSPINLGPNINTPGNEVTPFYDIEAGELYFASDGIATMGGFDLFRSAGFAGNWGQPENLGLPYNSSADDYYLALKSDGSGAFLASNRRVPGAKSSTRHDDLFELTSRPSPITLSASVFDGRSNQLVENFRVSVVELVEGGEDQPVVNQPFTAGTYSIDLIPGRTYRIEVAAAGYAPFAYEMTMESGPNAGYGRPAYLNPAVPGTPVPGAAAGRRAIDPGGTPYTAQGTGPRDNAAYTSSAPRWEGVYYRIQVAAMRNFDPAKFANVEGVAENLFSEYLPDRDLNRVLAGDFFDRAAAIAAARRLRGLGYSSAYVVEYRDGNRYGRVNF